MNPVTTALWRFLIESYGAYEFCIAFIILPMFLVCTVALGFLQAYKPVQIIHSAPVVLTIRRVPPNQTAKQEHP